MRSVILIFFLISSVQLYAENVDCPGQIIYDSETIDVIFSLPLASPISLAYDVMEAGVTYYDKNNDPVLLKPGRPKEIRFLFDDEVVKLKSLMYMAHDRTIVSIFLKVVIDGEVNVYQQYVPPVAYTFPVANSLGATTPTEWIPETVSYVLQKGKGEPKFCGMAIGFRKVMRKYFRDCPSLAELIKHRALRKADLLTIANFYNTKCNEKAILN
jgi:hypothetical protein